MHPIRLRRPMPIRCADDATYLLTRAVQQPLAHETLSFFLDRHDMGGLVVAVTGTTRPDMLFGVLESMCLAAQTTPQAERLVMASVRPDGGVLPGDVDRWLEASAFCDLFDIELVEWFVIGPHGLECPRDLLGEPERWPR
jgi:pimeloyl-ACP methyl ester carboxylesterase